MNRLCPLRLLACLLPLAARAQVPPSVPMLIHGSDISAAIADPLGTRRMVPLLQQGPYRVNLELHGGPTDVTLNEDAAELMVVEEGAGTLLLGGTLTDPVRTGAHLQAKSGQGATPYAVRKGDAVLIPQGLAHAIGAVDGRLVLMSLHVPPPADRLTGDGPLPELDRMLAMPLSPPAGAPPRPAPAPTPTSLPLQWAERGAHAALAACQAAGHEVGVAVTDDTGELRAGLGADGVSSGRIYTAVRKDMTVVALKMSSREARERALTDPALKAQLRPGMALFAGGLPIRRGDRFLGAIAVSGSTQLDDEKCAQAGLDAINSEGETR